MTTQPIILERSEGGITLMLGASGGSIDPRVDDVIADLAAHEAQAVAEARGAAIEQATATLVEARWLAFIRDCGSPSPSDPSLAFLGGDVTDAFQMPSSDDVLWAGADWFDGTTVNASDLYVGDALPVRNGAIQETTPGTFAVQFHMSGNTGVWLDAVSQGGAAAGRIWWPLCILNDGGTVRVGCLLIAPPDAQNPYGIVEASHIVTLSGFFTYASHIDVGITGFEIDGIWRDTTHTYIIDERPIAGVKETRLARVVNGSLLTVASWEHWNGSAWVSSAAAAVPLVDVAGQTLTGDGDIAKVADGHYVMVVHRTYDDSHLDVCNAAAPQGPWTSTARVPLGGSIGHTINGGLQISQIPRILDSNVLVGSERPPPEHSMVLMSRNLLGPTGAWSTRNIRRYAPQFVVVPQT